MRRLLLLVCGLALYGACCTTTRASISLAQSCNVSTAAVTTTTCTINTSTLTSGSLLVCGLYWGNVISGATYTVSDATNGTWTAVSGTPLNDGGPSNSLYLAWVKNTSTAASLAITLAVSGSGSHTIRGGCYEYTSTSGWPASPVDTTSTGTGSNSSATSGSAANVTPAASGELIFAAVGISGTTTANSFTVSGTGFTRRDAGGTAGSGWGSQTKAVGCDNTNSGNTATTCTFGWAGTPNWNWAMSQVVFKPTASGPPSGQFPRVYGGKGR